MNVVQQTLLNNADSLLNAEGATNRYSKDLSLLVIDQSTLVAQWYQILRAQVRVHRQNLKQGLRWRQISEHGARKAARALAESSQVELTVQVPLLRAVKALHDATLSQQTRNKDVSLLQAKVDRVTMKLLGPIALGTRFMGQSLPRYTVNHRKAAFTIWKEAGMPLPLPDWTDSLSQVDGGGDGLMWACLRVHRQKETQERLEFKKRVLAVVEGKLDEADFSRLKDVL